MRGLRYVAAVGLVVSMGVARSARADDHVPAQIPAAASPTPVSFETHMHDKGMAIGGGITLGLGVATLIPGSILAAGGGYGLTAALIFFPVGGVMTAVGLPILIVGAREERDLPKPPPAPIGPTHTNSPGMMIAGGVLLGVGAIAITGGAIGYSINSAVHVNDVGRAPACAWEAPNPEDCDRQFEALHSTFEPGYIGGIVSIVGGIAAIGVGIPLLGVGAKEVPVQATLSVGPGQVQVRGTF
jgi:hypothetical protein